MEHHKITESDSHYRNLDKKSTKELLQIINAEDEQVARAVHDSIEQIENFVEALIPRFLSGGRLFYLGSGTSGRLGVLDASEIPPTFGLAHDRVIGLIAGGDSAIRRAVEHAEDDQKAAWDDLRRFHPTSLDTILGITASGTTPYVLGAIREAKKEGLLTAGLSCNPKSVLSTEVDIPIEVVVGPEVVTGSTRMKSGSAQKMVLNMISTTLMIRIGLVQDHRMVHMQLTNDKLWDRAIRYLVEALPIEADKARELLHLHKSVSAVLKEFHTPLRP